MVIFAATSFFRLKVWLDLFMLVNDYFVYIHISRHGGTFLNNLFSAIPGSKLIQYHGHLTNLPEQYIKLPVIAFVRNPWDWYVSMYHNYKQKKQYIFQIISENGELDFSTTILRYLRLGDGSEMSASLVARISEEAPFRIDSATRKKVRPPGLTKVHFQSLKPAQGYYSWLFSLMLKRSKVQKIYIGRFEKIREETLRLLHKTNTPLSPQLEKLILESSKLNASDRKIDYKPYYSPSLRDLVYEKEADIISKFNYHF